MSEVGQEWPNANPSLGSTRSTEMNDREVPIRDLPVFASMLGSRGLRPRLMAGRNLKTQTFGRPACRVWLCRIFDETWNYGLIDVKTFSFRGLKQTLHGFCAPEL
jgi:hypothetical protein